MESTGQAEPAGLVEIPALAETALVVGVTAALAHMATAEEAPLTRAELRRRRAAQAETAAPQSIETAAEVPPLEPASPIEPMRAIQAAALVSLPALAAAEAAEPVRAIAAPNRLEAIASIDAPTATAAEQLAGTAFAAVGTDPTCIDDFDFSAQLFAFTGETPVQVAAAALAEETQEVPEVHTAPRHRRLNGRIALKRLAGVSFSMFVMSAVGLLAIGTTTPASIAAAVGETSADITVVAPKSATVIEDDEIQAYVAASDLTADALDRTEKYDVASMADIAADSGVTHFAGTWVNDPAAAIQWPFPVGVPVSAAYGSASYLAQFSSPHHGVDLAPGAGAEVHVIADGTVRLATEGGGDYGVNVIVDHVVDGQLVSTRYAHMQYGSLRVSAGDTVSVGDVLGKVGSTGKATGPHLHFEVLVNGSTRIDPYTWMQQHTTS
ncbi:hypothetical protein GCM10022382_17860 [Microbacterium invictum]